jgi:DNA-binding NarL/FixJ family response regulator
MAVRLLVVDDHAVVRRGVRALLEEQPGCEVCGEAASGREAVEQVRRLRPDIVVLDLSLPELNGLEATRQILAASPETEVLVLTMHDSEELVHQVLQAGARGYVVKSDAAQTLVAAVESLRRRKPFLSSSVTEFVLDSYVRRGEAKVDGDVARGEGARGEGARVQLTPREREIVQLVADGKSSKEIAAALRISVKTVEAHRANVMHKLQLHSVSELVRYAIRNQVVQP